MFPDEPTFDAPVARFEVWFQVVRTWFVPAQFGVWNPDVALLTPGTACVYRQDDVSETSNVSVVQTHAPTEAHPTVTRMRHDDHVVRRAGGIENFRLAIC